MRIETEQQANEYHAGVAAKYSWLRPFDNSPWTRPNGMWRRMADGYQITSNRIGNWAVLPAREGE